jgi:tetratricopeptide (TPR) repeat protein
MICLTGSPGKYFNDMKTLRLIIPLLVLLLSGCAGMTGPAPVEERAANTTQNTTSAPGTASEDGSDVQVYPAESSPWRAQPPATEGSQGAVDKLLAEASIQQRNAQPVEAAGLLERALRIEPRNAQIWHRLASVRMTQGQYRQAAALAAKSNSLASHDFPMQARNWRLIADARERLGQHSAAQEALQKAKEFESR